MLATALRLLRETLRVDRSRLEPAAALRTGAPVAVALAVGLALGRPLDGAIAAGGAFSAGFAALSSGYRTRAGAALLATLGLTVSTFVGAAAASSTAVFCLVLAAWGFAAGLLVSLGVAATIVGIQAVLGLLLISPYPMSLVDASGRAGLVALGGLAQLLVVVTLWPLRRAPVERRALAAAYLSLARSAAAVADGSARGLPEVAPFEAARASLTDPQPFAAPDDRLAFAVLLDRAEQARTALAAVAHTRERLGGGPASAAAVGAADAVVTAAAGLLQNMSYAIRRPSSRARMQALQATGRLGSPQRWSGLTDPLERLEEIARTTPPPADHAGASLVGELSQRCTELVMHLEAAGQGAGAASRQVASEPLLSRRTLQTLHAQLTLRSPVLRHALRLAAALPAGALLSLSLPPQHRYWLPLTALVVLKPDFTSTFTRGIGRILGTVAGAAITTALVTTARPGPVALAALVTVAAVVGYTVLLVNYALFGIAVTAFVVLLLGFTGLPDRGAVGERILATVVGGLLALTAYLLWPTWERARLRELLARLLDAQRRWAVALLDAYAGPGQADDDLGMLRAQVRLSRVSVEASLARAELEPGHRGLDTETAASLLAGGRECSIALLALQAHLPDASLPLPGAGSAGSAQAALDVLSVALDRALAQLVTALRTGRAPLPVVPPLREPLQHLHAALEELPPGRQLDAAVLDVELDQIVAVVLSQHAHLRAVGPVRVIRRV